MVQSLRHPDLLVGGHIYIQTRVKMDAFITTIHDEQTRNNVWLTMWF